MDASHFHFDQFKQHAFVWNSVFVSGQTQRVYEADDGKHDHLPQDSNLPTADLIDDFVQNRCQHDIHRYLYRQLQLTEFLNQADVHQLEHQLLTVRAPKAKILMDDRNKDNLTEENIVGNCRPSLGPLTACQLYQELKKDRTGHETLPDGKRRLIYVADFDPLCGLALVTTTSRPRSQYVRDFMDTYLAFRTYLGVRISSPYGPPVFCLEFHLPYYAWRRMMPITGRISRTRRDGRPLRISDEVIHLAPLLGNETQSLEKDYINEAQISIMFTGVDDFYWTSYCFVDQYFQDEDHSEQVQCLAETLSDPHSGGRHLSDPPLWNPRHFFLRTLSFRLSQVKEEWTNTVNNLMAEIRPWVHAFTRGETSGPEITQQPGFIWIMGVLRDHTFSLSETIESWESFKQGEARYFILPATDPDTQVSWAKILVDIDNDVEYLGGLRRKLIDRTKLIENMTTTISTHATYAETVMTRLQGQFVQAIVVISTVSGSFLRSGRLASASQPSNFPLLDQDGTIYLTQGFKFYLPPTLASTVFSMQSSLIPNARLKNWILTIVGLFIATAFLVTAVFAVNLPHATNFGQSIKETGCRTWRWLCYFPHPRIRWKLRWKTRVEIIEDVEMEDRESSSELNSGEV